MEGLADAIVEVDPRPKPPSVPTVCASSTRYWRPTPCSSPAAPPGKTRSNAAKSSRLILPLQGALRAESLVCLKMNAPSARLDAILDLLPSLNSPHRGQPARPRLAVAGNGGRCRLGPRPHPPPARPGRRRHTRIHAEQGYLKKSGNCVAAKTAGLPARYNTGFDEYWRKRAGTNQEFVPAPQVK